MCFRVSYGIVCWECNLDGSRAVAGRSCFVCACSSHIVLVFALELSSWSLPFAFGGRARPFVFVRKHAAVFIIIVVAAVAVAADECGSHVPNRKYHDS